LAAFDVVLHEREQIFARSVQPGMKRLLLLLVALAPAPTAFSIGLIVVHDVESGQPTSLVPAPYPPERRILPPPRPAWAPLEVNFTKADVRIQDQFATTTLEQEFYNPNPRQLEGTFLFPVPKGAHIQKFTMEVNGKPVEAELLSAEKARGIYEEIVRKFRDPALLEYAGRDLFKVRIFPIEPHAKKRITLSYAQLLKSDSGLVDFVFPLNTEKFSAKPLKTVSLKVEVETKHPLKSIYSPTHKVEIKRHGANRATIGYEAADVKPDTDFQLFYAQETDELGVNLLTYKAPGEDGYFVLLASPGVDAKNTRIIPKDVVFVLDTSGSMAGAKLEQAKKALTFCVENLNDFDRFEILRFATEVEPLFDKLADAQKDQRARAQNFIKETKPIGGTAINDALQKALALRTGRHERPFIVIFLTDGLPTVGATREDDIVENVKKGTGGNVRVFCFGIGHDVNTHLLDRITEETRAFSQYVLPEEDIEVKVSSFFTKIKEPVLAGPKITFPESVRVTKLYPSPVPDLFKGEQLILAGRYSGKGDGAIGIEGSVSGETKRFAYDVKFPEQAADHDFIPRLWATRRVGYLLDEIRLRGESKELKDEVVELARKYSIVTPYTAYLIQEDETRRGIAVNAQSLHFENQVLLQDGRDFYLRQQREKDGAAAVAGARSFYSLKSAENAGDAIVNGNAEALRLAAPAPARLVGRPGEHAQSLGGEAAGTKLAAQELAQQSRFVGGKTFFQNGSQWVDSEVQKFVEARKVRVQFGSTEYFTLLKKQPQVAQWAAQGTSVQFVLANTVFEIHD
jgi:Ca-activated chloride channel family protein